MTLLTLCAIYFTCTRICVSTVVQMSSYMDHSDHRNDIGDLSITSGYLLFITRDGVLFSIDFFLCLFIFFSFFVSLPAGLRANGWTDLHEIFGKVWSDHGTTWLHFSSIPRNRAMPRCATRGRGLLCFASQLVSIDTCNKACLRSVLFAFCAHSRRVCVDCRRENNFSTSL